MISWSLNLAQLTTVCICVRGCTLKVSGEHPAAKCWLLVKVHLKRFMVFVCVLTVCYCCCVCYGTTETRAVF